ncbi:MAG: hypothetical protein V2B18_03325 [Pseudomonadota bacterium]
MNLVGKIYGLTGGCTLLLLGLTGGCVELNQAVDGLLGKSAPVMSANRHIAANAVIPVKKSAPGEQAAPPAGTKPPEGQPAGPAPAPKAAGKGPAAPDPAETKTALAQGKRRPPGAAKQTQTSAVAEKKDHKALADVNRDPFRQPTEILPSDCPPSMPLCRFDRSQLKLVGVLQVNEGEYKGMVEDPDGRGYFVTSGMQIGGATVTQVSQKGMVLFDHKTRQDVSMPLVREAREGGTEL